MNDKSKVNADSETSIISLNDDSGFIDLSPEHLCLITNEEAKLELRQLNNRLANYIEHIQHRDLYNATIRSVEEVSKIPSKQLNDLKQVYEDEIKGLRHALKEQSNEAAKLKIANDKLIIEKKNIENDLVVKSQMFVQLTDNLLQLKTENEALKKEASLVDSSKKEASNLLLQLKECQNQLETEVLLRTSADNACLTYKEKMEFDDAISKKEFLVLSMTHKSVVNKLETLQNNLSKKLFEQIEEARKKFNNHVDELLWFVEKNLLNKIEKTSNLVMKNFRDNLNSTKNKINLLDVNNEFLTELSNLKASHMMLKKQLSEMGSLHEEEISGLYRNISSASSDDIQHLDEHISSTREFGQLISKTAQLDTDILMYQRMLKAEKEGSPRCFSPFEKFSKTKKLEINYVSYLNSERISSKLTSRPILRASRRNKVCNLM